MLELRLDPGELRTQWAQARGRGLLMAMPKENDIDAEALPGHSRFRSVS